MTARGIHTHYEPRYFNSRKDWDAYARWLTRHIKVSLGLLPEPPRTPLKAKVFGRWEGAGYTSEKVCFESIPGFFVTGNLYRPLDGAKKKRPAVLCPHGHWPDGRLHDREPRGGVMQRCISMARLGMIVFSYDMTGYNDSCQLRHREFPPDHMFGLSMMGLQTWNSIRAIDFVQSLKDIDSRRIGVTGASGGGTQTYALTAVDDRVKACAPICMVSYQMQGGCICENAPLLRIDATSVDIARLAAPRPMFLGSCTGDWTKDSLTEEVPAIKHVYGFHKARTHLKHLHVNDDHNYNQEMREHVYGFFSQHLLGRKSARPIKEDLTWIQRPPHPDRLVWYGRTAPVPISNKQFRNMWRERQAAILRPHLRTAAAVRKNLGLLLSHSLGMTLDSVAECTRRKPGHIKLAYSRGVCSVKLASRKKAPDDPQFNAYNRTAFAEQVHEVLALLRNVPGEVVLEGKGSAGPTVLAAAGLSPKVTSIRADLRGFDPGRDMSWQRSMDTPSIRQIGGLATIFSLIGSRPLELVNAGLEIRKLARKYAK